MIVNLNINLSLSSIEEVKKAIAEFQGSKVTVAPIVAQPLGIVAIKKRTKKILKKLKLDRAPRATLVEVQLRQKIDRERSQRGLPAISWGYDLFNRIEVMKENGFDIFAPPANGDETPDDVATSEDVKINLDDVPE